MKDNMSKETRGRIGLLIMITLVLGLMQATHYTKASHLMGAFIAGLVFCTDHDVHVMFVSQFKRVLQVSLTTINNIHLLGSDASLILYSLSCHVKYKVVNEDFLRFNNRISSSYYSVWQRKDIRARLIIYTCPYW